MSRPTVRLAPAAGGALCAKAVEATAMAATSRISLKMFLILLLLLSHGTLALNGGLYITPAHGNKLVLADGRFTPFSGAHAHGIVHRMDEDLPVPDMARQGRPLDGHDDLLRLLVGHDQLDAGLGDQVHLVRLAAYLLLYSLLYSVPLYLRDI